ncbi:hypothetical protein P154DRAFT_548962 [Amniculicola lignicola CBS 123094]|uniref:Ribosomal RNA-processing protein 42 n=1 Tax=Amniculicola lignicola CBS 123094 TaxID=1392246 RepID=A0A6A5W348_9PLEO|nr:hypothetical protein P154DRAFT_548962 [Amniculicola lignicola CBS 123094]
MPPSQPALVSLSPAELSYLRSTLAQRPPIRLDATKGPLDFRSMRAEHDVLPGTNGSARIALEDGTEALVGVKAAVEPSPLSAALWAGHEKLTVAAGVDTHRGADNLHSSTGRGRDAWVEMSVEIPGFRDDDALPVFLAAMLRETLLATGALTDRLHINRRFHWKLCIDILLLSPPLSYPLALLSMTTHLALLTTRLPALKSENDEDPMFDDDWDAAVALYPRSSAAVDGPPHTDKPPVIVLAMVVGENIIFDPCKEELAVADGVLAIACASAPSPSDGARLVGFRTVDPPSHLTPPGVPNAMNTATGGVAPASSADALTQRELLANSGVWRPPRGGIKRALLANMCDLATAKGGVAEELLSALQSIEVG